MFTLWNIYYDGILRLPVAKGMKLIGYDDDLVIVMVAEDNKEIGKQKQIRLHQKNTNGH